MKLPKLYRVVTVKFWSLRNGVGSSLGMIFDVDAEVTRKVRRVMAEEGWRWQIVNFINLLEWDYFVEQDQDILNDAGSLIDLEIIYLTKNGAIK